MDPNPNASSRSFRTVFAFRTVYEEHALLLFSIRPENSDWILEWWPMAKYILKHK